MKQLLLTGLLCAAGWLPTHAQSLNAELTAQITALQTLEHTVQQGYRLVTNGLQTIGGISEDEYQLHSGYFGSLSTVKPVLSADPTVVALQAAQQSLIRQLQAALDYWRKQPSIQP